MKKIKPIENVLPKEFLKQIISQKNWDRKTLLEAKLITLEQAYDYYLENKNKLEGMNPNSLLSWDKDLLLHCYNSDTIASESLKKQIKRLSYKCSYCNIDRPREVDHYLPKEEFPEFSVLTLNLMPTCSTCNKKKGLRWKNSSNQRIFLNVYFDYIPEEQFLFVKIVLLNGIPIVSFFVAKDLINEVPTEIWELINRHVTEFNLTSRYTEEVNDVIGEMTATLLAKDITLDLESVRKILWDEAKAKEMFYGNNYWKRVLYLNISENDELCNWLLEAK